MKARTHRFGVKSDELVPFFDGDYVRKRMNRVRDAIAIVRHEPASQVKVARRLRRLVDDCVLEYVESAPGPLKRRDREAEVEAVRPHLRAVLSGRRDWADRSPNLHDRQYSVVRLYTSNIGQYLFAKIAKDVFRSPKARRADIVAAAFLIELLNIDLFNYWLVTKTAQAYTGEVFRGVRMSSQGFKKLSALATKPIAARYYSVPLGIDSCSKSKQEAVKFLESVRGVALLQRVHVIGLSDEQLKFYHKRTKSSVVSTICATPIQALSEYPNEQEVLLRGPFFQLLRLRR